MRDGATRERRTPSRCIQGSYAPERWWRGDQPWDRTTFSRASAERYDHTSSLVVIGADGGSRTRACALRGRRAAGNTSSTWSRLEDSNLDPPVIGRKSCRWTKPGLVPSAGVEPASFRLKGGRIAALPRRDEAGWQTWTRTTIRGVKGRCPAIGRSANGRVGRSRTSTHLRPRQVGYRLPYDPVKLRHEAVNLVLTGSTPVAHPNCSGS